MHKTVVGICIWLGVPAIPCTILWCMAGAGIYGSPLAHFHGADLWGLLALLAFGPLSLLPAGLVGRKHPLGSGLWFLGGGISSFLLVAMNGGGFEKLFGPNADVDLWIPIALICGPMILLGMGFLKGELNLRGKVLPWRLIGIGAAAAAAGGMVWFGCHLLTRPIWTVILTPVDGPSTRFSVDSREVSFALQENFVPLFRNPPAAGRKVMGTYEVIGPMIGHGSRVRNRYHCVVEVTPTWTTVYQNCRQLTTYETPEACMAAACRGGVHELLNTMIANDSRPGRF